MDFEDFNQKLTFFIKEAKFLEKKNPEKARELWLNICEFVLEFSKQPKIDRQFKIKLKKQIEAIIKRLKTDDVFNQRVKLSFGKKSVLSTFNERVRKIERDIKVSMEKMKNRKLEEKRVKERQRLAEVTLLEKKLERLKYQRAREKEIEILKRIKKMMEVSTRIRLDVMRDALDMNSKVFNSRIFDWAEKFNFKINGDFVIIEQADVEGFIADLDNQFEMWESNERTGKK
jgi:hypothetical protein